MKSATKVLLKKTYMEIWKRGEKYADKGLVRIEQHNDKEISAKVQGTKAYSVVLKFAANGISQECDCPYFRQRGYICKHIVAVAIIWDEERGISRPDQSLVSRNSVPAPEFTRSDVNKLFGDPRNADLDMLRVLPEITALGGYVRPHSKLPVMPKISSEKDQPLTLKEVQKCFSEIRRWSRRKTFDPYFCAGEMVAAFCEMLRIVESRLASTPPVVAAEILLSAQKFNYTLILELIDDSQGLHAFSEAHLESIFSCFMGLSVGSQEREEFERLLREFEERGGDY